MKEFAERHKLISKPRKMLISSFKLDRGPIITPLLLFYLEKGLVLTDVIWFLQYTPRECFQSFVQKVVDARREGDRNKDSTAVAETMKFIGNSSYGYQIMDRSRHTTTKYAKGPQVDKFINNRFFKTLNELPEKIYEVEMSKTRIDHKEPIIVGFLFCSTLNLQCYNSSTISSPLSATKISTNSLNWIPTVCTWHLVKKNLTKSFDQKRNHCGTG